MRQPLLHVLDVEYARAARVKNLSRMEEITAIVEALKRLWADPQPEFVPEPAQEPVSLAPMPLPQLEAAPVVPWQGQGDVQEWQPPADPAPLPQPVLDTQEALGMAPVPPQSWELGDLMARVPEGVWGDEERRAEAKGRIKDTVLRSAQTFLGDQMRYELAMQAYNRNHRALELFEAEALALGVSVADLAARIIAERRTAERRMSHAYAVLARVSGEIDQAEGDAIEQLAGSGIQEIQAMED